MIKIEDLLIKHEGLRTHAYYDTTGHLTIGVGHNLTDNGLPQEIILQLLQYDINDTQTQLSERLYWFDAAPEAVKIVLIDMAFNMGVSGLMTFYETLEHIKQGDYKNASIEMLNSKWAKQTGYRAIDLSEILKSI